MIDEKRFWEKVQKKDDCWLWVGHKNTMTGVGIFAVARGDFRDAHILSWEMANGKFPEPEGREIVDIEQTCKKPNCVRPDHIRVLVAKSQEDLRKQKQKLDDADKKLSSREQYYRMSNEERKNRTHCFAGHPYSGDNLIMKNDGSRRCRACRNEARRQNRALKRAKKQLEDTFVEVESSTVEIQETEKPLIL